MTDLGHNGAFILGPARCGSTLVSEILKTHPDILSLSEFLAFQGTRALLPGPVSGATYWTRLSRQTRLMRRVMTAQTAPNEFLYPRVQGRFPIDNVPPVLATTLPHLSDDPDRLFDDLSTVVPRQPRQSMAAHHAMLFDRLMALCGGRIWVERSGMSLMYARHLPRLFPAAKIAMLYRDGRNVALSLQAFQPARLGIWTWAWLRRFGLNPIDPEWPVGRSPRLAFNERWMAPLLPLGWMLRTPPPLKACAGFWSALTLNALPEVLRLPADRRYLFSFERLTDDPHGEIARLMAFLGVDAAPGWLESAARLPQRLEPRWTRLDAGTRRDLTAWTQEARAAVTAHL